MSSKSSSHNSNEGLNELFAILFQGIFAIILAGIFLALSLASALGFMAKENKEDGILESEILINKLKTLVGLIPFVLLGSVLLAVYFPTGKEFKPKTEEDFVAVIEKAKSVYERELRNIREAQYYIKNDKENIAEYKVKIRRAKDIEDVSAFEARIGEYEIRINENKEILAKSQEKAVTTKDLMMSARNSLQDLRSKKGGPIHISAKDIEQEERLQFKETACIAYGYFVMAIGWLFASLLLSYLARPFMYAFEDKRFYEISKFFAGFWQMISKMGSYPFVLIFGLYKKSSSVKKPNSYVSSNVMALGRQKKAFLTEKNLNYHTQIIGGSGAGKTNLLKVMIEDRVRKGHSVIFFDFKADIELMDWMTGLAEDAERRGDLEMISMSDPDISHKYNPLKYGSETEITSQIMNSLTWSESFYRDVAESGLMVMVKALCFRRDYAGKRFFLSDIDSFLTDASYRMDILADVLNLNYPEWNRASLRRLCEELSTNKKDNYQGLINQISKILNSSAGEIVSPGMDDNFEFNFKESISNGKIAYLFMNSLKLKETASIMGKLMLQDLMKTVGGIYDDRNFEKRPVTLIIDEFASFATPDFGEFIEKARGAGIGVIVAYQSRQSLNSIEGDLALKLNENTANKVVFQVQDSEDAEWFCSLVGTKKVEKETHQAEEGFLFGDTKTGMKSVREVEEYIIHPNQLKNLKAGEALLVSSKVDPHFCLMNIYRANEYQTQYVKKTNAAEEYVKQSFNNLKEPVVTEAQLSPDELI